MGDANIFLASVNHEYCGGRWRQCSICPTLWRRGIIMGHSKSSQRDSKERTSGRVSLSAGLLSYCSMSFRRNLIKTSRVNWKQSFALMPFSRGGFKTNNNISLTISYRQLISVCGEEEQRINVFNPSPHTRLSRGNIINLTFSAVIAAESYHGQTSGSLLQWKTFFVSI